MRQYLYQDVIVDPYSELQDEVIVSCVEARLMLLKHRPAIPIVVLMDNFTGSRRLDSPNNIRSMIIQQLRWDSEAT